MLEHEILWDDNGLLWLGREGEESYGRRNFLELFSVFLSPPVFTVLHGHQEIGCVDEMNFLDKREGPRTLLLGGQPWRVNYIDWHRRVAYVEPSDLPGRSRWKGAGQGLGFALCQAIKLILADDDGRQSWSCRAAEGLQAIRAEYPWIVKDSTSIVQTGDAQLAWWTFAGKRANATLANTLAQIIQSRIEHDNFTLTFQPLLSLEVIEPAIAELAAHNPADMLPEVNEQAAQGFKFSDCVSMPLALDMLQRRLRDIDGTRRILSQPLGFVTHFEQ